MPLAKGLILMAYFSLACGALTAVNVALLRGLGGGFGGALGTALALIVAFLEALVLLALVDRFFLRPRVGARREGAFQDSIDPPLSGKDSKVDQGSHRPVR